MVTLSEEEYRNRVRGGWVGKLIGSAVGVPGDGERQVREVEGPGALARGAEVQEGLDFQLAWLRALQAVGPRLDGGDLMVAWLRHLNHGHGEYPYARANFRKGLTPPICGAYNNPFREGVGALARADFWGMVAPGDPERAAWYARQDGCLDHAGAGVEAAIWLAAMASAAFVVGEPARVIEVGVGLLPGEGKVARAVRDVVRWHGEHAHWGRTREMLLRAYGSEEVRDSAVCAGMVALSLLHGRGDFGRTVLTGANCGWSSGITCGAAGAMVGLMVGADGIPEEWRGSVGEEVRASWAVVGLPGRGHAAMLAEQTCEMGRLVVRSECAGRVQISEEAPEEAGKLATPEASGLVRQLAMGPYVSRYRRGPLEVHVDHDGRPTIGYDVPRRLTVEIANAATRSLELQARVSAPAGFVVTADSGVMMVPEGGTVSFMVTISAPREHARISVVNPCTLFVSAEDGWEATVPIGLVGEAIWYAAGPYGDFGEEHAPEEVGVVSGQAALGGEGWQRLSVAEPAVNLLADLKGERGTYYVGTDFAVPRSGGARLRVGCNDGTKVWVNGREVFEQHDHRPSSPVSGDEFGVELREGWNRLVIKMAQCSPRRFLSAVLKDGDGQLLLAAANTFPRAGE